MSTTSKKRTQRRARGAQSQQQQVQGAASQPTQILPLPQWNWRTFPVFFAFALGLFLGSYFGVLAGDIQARNDNPVLVWVIFITSALLLGLAFSRFTTRWMLSRKIYRAQRK